MKLIFRLFAIPALLFISHLSFSQNLSYKVSTVWKEMSNDSVVVSVNQSGNKALATLNDRPIQVSDPDAGIKAAAPDNRMALLIDAISSPSNYKAGDVITDGFTENSTATIKSFDYSLEKTKEKQTIEGQKAEKYTLTARLEVSVVGENGDESKVVTTGEADYWVASKLPFSWLPYTLANNNFKMSAIPFGFVRPGVASFLLDHYKDDLIKMGLLLQASTNTTVTNTHQHGEFSNSYVREVKVTNLETGVDNSVELPDLEFVTEEKFGELMAWMFISRDYCSTAAGAIEAPMANQEIQGNGTLQFRETDERTKTTWLSAGVLNYQDMESESGCLIVGIKPAEIEAGEYSLMNQVQFADLSAESPTGAVVCYISISGGAPTISMLKEGNMKLTGEKGSMQAVLKGKAMSLQLDQVKSKLMDTDLQLSMDVQME